MSELSAQIDTLLLAHFGVKTKRISSAGGMNVYDRFCTCGAPLPWSSDTMSAAHRAHIADVLVDALFPLVRAGVE